MDVSRATTRRLLVFHLPVCKSMNGSLPREVSPLEKPLSRRRAYDQAGVSRYWRNRLHFQLRCGGPYIQIHVRFTATFYYGTMTPDGDADGPAAIAGRACYAEVCAITKVRHTARK